MTTKAFETFEMDDEIEQTAEQYVKALGREDHINDYHQGRATAAIELNEEGVSINDTGEGEYVVGKDLDDGFFGMSLDGGPGEASMPGGWTSHLSADAYVLGRTNTGEEGYFRIDEQRAAGLGEVMAETIKNATEGRDELHNPTELKFQERVGHGEEFDGVFIPEILIISGDEVDVYNLGTEPLAYGER